MSSLAATDRRNLEKLLRMSSGYVLDFSDRTFREFVMDAVGLDIHSDKYTTEGMSKANKLRALWRLEPDNVVGRLLLALIDHEQGELLPNGREHADHVALTKRCRQIANRLLAAIMAIPNNPRSVATNHAPLRARHRATSSHGRPRGSAGTEPPRRAPPR